MGPAAVSPTEMMAELLQLWFAYLLCCHGACVLSGEHDCLATRRMLVCALWAPSAAVCRIWEMVWGQTCLYQLLGYFLHVLVYNQ